MTERFGARASLLAIVMLTAGCAGSGSLRSAPPPEDVDFARRYLALFQSRSWAAIEMGMDPSLKDPQLRSKMIGMASLFPPGEPASVPLIGWNVNRSGSTTTSSLSFQYQVSGKVAPCDCRRRTHGAGAGRQECADSRSQGVGTAGQPGEPRGQGPGALCRGRGRRGRRALRALRVRPGSQNAGARHEMGVAPLRDVRHRAVRVQLDDRYADGGADGGAGLRVGLHQGVPIRASGADDVDSRRGHRVSRAAARVAAGKGAWIDRSPTFRQVHGGAWRIIMIDVRQIESPIWSAHAGGQWRPALPAAVRQQRSRSSRRAPQAVPGCRAGVRRGVERNRRQARQLFRRRHVGPRRHCRGDERHAFPAPGLEALRAVPAGTTASTGRSRGGSARRPPSGRWVRRTAPTRSRSSFPATVSSAGAAA